MTLLTETARAKVNLTLRVLGRRPDGYHDLESLVAFADCADTLTLASCGCRAWSRHHRAGRARLRRPGRQSGDACRRGSLAERIARSARGRVHARQASAGRRPGSAAVRRMLRLPCGCWRAPTISCDRRCADCRALRRRPAPTCRSAWLSRACMMRGAGEQMTPMLDMPAMPCRAGQSARAGVCDRKDVFAALGLGKPGELFARHRRRYAVAGMAAERALFDEVDRWPSLSAATISKNRRWTGRAGNR